MKKIIVAPLVIGTEQTIKEVETSLDDSLELNFANHKEINVTRKFMDGFETYET